MNIGEIKRYINDGLQPLSTLIGTADDAAAKIGSLHAKSSFIIEKLADVATSISNISSGLAGISGEKHYEVGNTLLFEDTQVFPKNFQSNQGYNILFLNNVFYPKYDGIVKASFQVQMLYAVGGQRYNAFILNLADFMLFPQPANSAYANSDYNSNNFKTVWRHAIFESANYKKIGTEAYNLTATQLPFLQAFENNDLGSTLQQINRTTNFTFFAVKKGFPIRPCVAIYSSLPADLTLKFKLYGLEKE